jgi:ABC-type nitrate/sulfonate/bicarbonate transport system substrate-binding protein
VSTFGGDSHAAVLAALKVLGLTDKDVTIQQIGGQSARIAALKAGSVAAAPIDGTIREQMKAEGFNILVQLLDSPALIAKTGLHLREDWRMKNPNAALAVVAATLESMNMIFQDPEKAAAGLAKWQQLKDPASAVGVMKQWVTFAQRDLRWKKEAWDALKEVQQIAEPEIKDLAVEKAYTFEYLDKLRDMGFNQAIGLPNM